MMFSERKCPSLRRYGGQLCAAENHTHHTGLLDSTYWQTRLQSEMYQVLRSQVHPTNE